MELFNQTYQIFTAVGLFVFSLALLEVVLFFFGGTFSSLFDADHDVSVDGLDALDSFNADFDLLEMPAASGVELTAGNFFNIGKVPFFVVLMFLGVFFSIFGIGIHKLAETLNFGLSNFVAVPASIVFSSLMTWIGTSFCAKILPGEESYALKESEFIGREAIVEDGEGNNDLGVMVSFVDEHNVTHRLLGTVVLENITVKRGDKVVLLNKNKTKGGFYILPSYAAYAQERMNLEAKEVVAEKTMTAQLGN